MDPGAASKKTVRVTIFNQNYSLRAAGDTEQVEDVARMVDDLMHSISARAGTTDAGRTGVLACLHLADQLRAVQDELREYKQLAEQTREADAALQSYRRKVADRARHLISLLDRAAG
ncbi:MAG: cell division protein ZapA [Bryobacter sp.]|jgi:cell division protein ZapA (FtsZ GTPase activity inhibitor)|nr:cell division protein ZapA [Bryobacter sp.]